MRRDKTFLLLTVCIVIFTAFGAEALPQDNSFGTAGPIFNLIYNSTDGALQATVIGRGVTSPQTNTYGVITPILNQVYDATLGALQIYLDESSLDDLGLVLTPGSIPFAGADGFLTEDNDGLFWDASNFSLKLRNTQIIRVPNQTDFLGTFIFGDSAPALSHVSGNDGRFNIIIGSGAGSALTKGSFNLIEGYQAGYKLTTGTANVFQAAYAGYNTTTGAANMYQGFQAGYANSTGGNNLFSGYQAGRTNLGNGNIFLGYQAGYNETGSNKLYIENSNSTTPLIYGEFDNNKVHINGELTMDELTATSFTSDPCGTLSIGSMWYNSTAGIPCYCDNSGNDLKFSDNSACF